jgi:23S rRNA (uracil1939-C5)-methyltransferase
MNAEAGSEQVDEGLGTVPPGLVLTTTAPVAGGAALGRDPSGRVVFVAGALPGERVEVDVTETKKDFARATVRTIVHAAPERVEPPCPFLADGCGGCDLQHLAPEAQPALKLAVVRDALRRIAHLPDADVLVAPALAPFGFRTTVRCAVDHGRLGFRAAHSHDVVEIDRCLVAHPLIDELLAILAEQVPSSGIDEVTVRVGANTGERMVIADRSADDLELPAAFADVTVVGVDELDAGHRAWIHEEVHGFRFRVSARSFFQTRVDGAEALVDAVIDLGGDELEHASTVVDAYSGVGLFSALAAPQEARVIAVEASRSSTADARVNLQARGKRAKVVTSSLERWRPARADVVIADPSRSGLGRTAAGVLSKTGAGVVVLVSCDPAALARDAGLLGAHGFALDQALVVDLFPQTHHVEVVSRFVR